MLTTYQQWYADLMDRAADMTVREALSKGYQICPVCNILHPGIRYMHPNHREYCTKECYAKRKTIVLEVGLPWRSRE